jgi:hypothetical protein
MVIVNVIQEIYLGNGNRVFRKEGTKGEIIWTFPNGCKIDDLTSNTIEAIYQNKIKK